MVALTQQDLLCSVVYGGIELRVPKELSIVIGEIVNPKIWGIEVNSGWGVVQIPYDLLSVKVSEEYLKSQCMVLMRSFCCGYRLYYEPCSKEWFIVGRLRKDIKVIPGNAAVEFPLPFLVSPLFV